MLRQVLCVVIFMVMIAGEAFSQEIMTVEQALEVAVSNYPGIKELKEEVTIKKWKRTKP
jgi:hypothetical protein